MSKEKVFIAGAAGSMGFETFKSVWNKCDTNGDRRFDIVLLLFDSRKNRKLLAPYLFECGIGFSRSKIIEKNGLKVIWGDGRKYEDIQKAVSGVDFVLNCMAIISPRAEKEPENTKNTNLKAVEYIIKAIKEQPNGTEHIRFVNVGSIAEYGDRMGRIHAGRVGDPVVVSPFDIYAITKVKAERLVIESGLKHWVQLRQTFIMIPNVFSLEDPIMFHQPIGCFMENITARAAGKGMANCLEIPHNSDFWRKVYNMGGGPECRTNYLDFLNDMFGLMGLRYQKIFERKWFALRNFHMQYYADSNILNEYLNHWGDTLDDFKKSVSHNLPWYLKTVVKLNKSVPAFRNMVEKITRRRMKNMAMRRTGNLRWITENNDLRIAAFYGSRDAYDAIPDWDAPLPEGLAGTPEPECIQLNHGYDQTKESLEVSDLQSAANFRGGKLISEEWDQDMYCQMVWECEFGHRFEASAYAVLKAGHWCTVCEAPPWNYDEIARRNPFFAQVWHESHSPDEDHFYPELCYDDIL
ncbi:MAG: NAD(P)-dependent oxidoreductase [Bacteroidales bacterium]|nr:NAD(P)-dependent oxidoreductase [Bacteroidales bacterium]HOY38388.1 NAD(P)-dependent oxidoreductase [Bacteroidales bacterium]HQP04344.1 NAD(P)-dependent oxidoreductase [Bacteroidales bacterium]